MFCGMNRILLRLVAELPFRFYASILKTRTHQNETIGDLFDLHRRQILHETTYRWFDDGDVEVRTVTGDDDWDSYNGHDSESTRIVRFESLSKDIQDCWKANQR